MLHQNLPPARRAGAGRPGDRAEALELLADPDLLERIVEDFSRAGLVGEEVNKLTGYLAAVSRKLEEPLAVLIQSSSAAGKSSLMDAILELMPPEERVQYSAMTGQSLFYMHRPQSQGFKASVLNDLIPVDLRTEGGVYLGSGEMMLQNADRIIRVVNRIVRGLYTRRTGKVLPADWPVCSDLMDGTELQPMLEPLNIRFFDIGNRTLLYDSKHLEDDDREALFWLIFYNSVHFWGYTGTQIRSRFPW